MTIELDESKPTLHVYGKISTREQRTAVAGVLRDIARAIEDDTLPERIAENATAADPRTMAIGDTYLGGFVSLGFEPKVTLVPEVAE